MGKAKRKQRAVYGLEELRQLSLFSWNAVFTTIDFEGTNTIISGFQHRGNAQAGLSIFDTCHFSLPHISSQSINSHSIDTQSTFSPATTSVSSSPQSTSPFKTFNFIVGSNTYFETSSSKSLCGITERIPKSEILSKIETCIPKDRNIILIGHGIQAEISVLEALDFDFGNVRSIYDTYELVGMGECSLQNLLAKLGHPSPAEYFHNAGNDATFTMRAFILLLVQDLKSRAVLNSEFINNLQELAERGFEILGDAAILPDQTNKWTRAKPIMIHGVRKTTASPKNTSRQLSDHDGNSIMKIREPPKRFLAKSWTAEMQETVREKRKKNALALEQDCGTFWGGE